MDAIAEYWQLVSDTDCGVRYNFVVSKRTTPRNRMRESLTYGSAGRLAEQSLTLPGKHEFRTAAIRLAASSGL